MHLSPQLNVDATSQFHSLEIIFHGYILSMLDFFFLKVSWKQISALYF